MPKIRSVVVWTVAAAVTVAIEVVGLGRAIDLRDELTEAPACPAPVAVAVPPTPPTEISALPLSPPPVRLLTVRDDAVVIEAGGQRHELPGYPPPASPDLRPGRLTTALVAPGADLIAVAGECPGESGISEPRPPSCAPVFVRLYRVADGSHVRDLKLRWRDTDIDRRHSVALAFDERAERLAVLMQTSWSDCMWDGDYAELLVYRLADGARVARRVFGSEESEEARDVHFQGDEVHVLTTGQRGRPKHHVIPLPTVSRAAPPRPRP